MSLALGLVALIVASICVMQLIDEVRALAVDRAMRARFPTGVAAGSAVEPPPSETRVLLLAVSSRVRRLGERIALRVGVDPSRRRADRAVLLLLETTTRRLRSGHSLRSALAEATADAPDRSTRDLSAALGAGEPFEESVERWVGEHDAGESRSLAGTALALASRSGGAVAGVLDGVAASLRDRLALDREVAALSSQARSSATLLIAAPLVFAVVMSSLDGRLSSMLVGTPWGWCCLGVGALLDLVGALWMARLIRSVR